MNAPLRASRVTRTARAQAGKHVPTDTSTKRTALVPSLFDTIPDTHLIKRDLHETIQALSVGSARDYEIAKLLESAYAQGAEAAEEAEQDISAQEMAEQSANHNAMLSDIECALNFALTLPAETEEEFQQFAARICDIQEVIGYLRANTDDSFADAATELDKEIPLE